ncbi:MAG: hypothetical protein QM764_02970 [Chitinophagaceae bacterium]
MDVSGDKTKIYSVIVDNDTDTLYENFVAQNMNSYRAEVNNIDDRLFSIGNEVGLFSEFFDTGAGEFGENLCTLKDRPRSKLRLYFIEYGNAAIILGGGGVKPKSARTTQQVPLLYAENRKIGAISRILQKAEKVGHFKINEDGTIMSTTNYIYHSEHYE